MAIRQAIRLGEIIHSLVDLLSLETVCLPVYFDCHEQYRSLSAMSWRGIYKHMALGYTYIPEIE